MGSDRNENELGRVDREAGKFGLESSDTAEGDANLRNFVFHRELGRMSVGIISSSKAATHGRPRS